MNNLYLTEKAGKQNQLMHVHKFCMIVFS